MRNKPPYALDSVDNALRLLQMLRDQGKLRVSQAASELGIARSTAHRLLATLVYRGFAEQDEDRCYRPGPSLALPLGDSLQQLRDAAHPAMDRLCEHLGETVNLMVRAGPQTRFLLSVESPQMLRVGDRRGTILPAAKSSGGKALLAELEPGELSALYRIGPEEPAVSQAEWEKLTRELKLTRRRGYGVNTEETETGVYAIGMAVHDASGLAAGALSVAVPTVRVSKQRTSAFVAGLRVAVEATERALTRP